MPNPPNHIVIGVAGHIDHGKTSLVGALTGIDTDRLKEEKERGMSIVLGFAPLTLPGSDVIDFIDAPGHERFVGTMIAGASGIDALLLVVDASERIKPQTAEHVALAELLGVRRGIVVLSKCDLLEVSEREEAAADVRAFLSETILADAEMIFTSATTGEGLPKLRQALGALCRSIPERAPKQAFWLPIDRAFVIAGHGTVVTGTLHGAPIRAGETVQIVPGDRRVDIRGLEVHGQAVEAAEPGWRVAVNLRGVKADQIRSGDALCTPDRLRATNLLDVTARLLPGARPLAAAALVRLHFGTSAVTARAYPLSAVDGSFSPGDSSYLQLRLTEPVAAPMDTPIILRALTPVETLGGGRILDTHPTRKSRLTDAALLLLDSLATSNPAERVAAKLLESGPNGRILSELLADLDSFVTPETVSDDVVRCAHGIAVHRTALKSVQSDILRAVSTFHEENRRVEGMPVSAVNRIFPPGARREVVDAAVDDLMSNGMLASADGLMRLADFQPQPLTPDEARIVDSIENSFRRAKLQPPDAETVTRAEPLRRELYRMLVRSGRLISLCARSAAVGIVFHTSALAEAEGILHRYWSDHAEGFTVSEANQILGTSRKFSIPLLEHFDALGKTRRIGDRRVFCIGETDTRDTL